MMTFEWPKDPFTVAWQPGKFGEVHHRGWKRKTWNKTVLSLLCTAESPMDLTVPSPNFWNLFPSSFHMNNASHSLTNVRYTFSIIYWSLNQVGGQKEPIGMYFLYRLLPHWLTQLMKQDFCSSEVMFIPKKKKKKKPDKFFTSIIENGLCIQAFWNAFGFYQVFTLVVNASHSFYSGCAIKFWEYK